MCVIFGGLFYLLLRACLCYRHEVKQCVSLVPSQYGSHNELSESLKTLNMLMNK